MPLDWPLRSQMILPGDMRLVVQSSTCTGPCYQGVPYDVSQASVTVEPQKVPIKSEFTVNWSVPRTSEADYILICPHYGQYGEYNGQEMFGKDGPATSGSLKMQAPDAPGQYEVRYYPRWLDSATTGHGHHGYWAPTTFTVTPAYDRN